MKKIFFSFVMSFVAPMLFSQSYKPVQVNFKPMFGSQELVLNDSVYTFNLKDSVYIETLKFYISGIELLCKNKMVWKENNSYHLINLSEENTLHLMLQVPKNIHFEHIKFYLGIDSGMNTSGAQGGDLDPTKGMFWTWQSGYINFKLEGKSNACATRKHEFMLHLGGYLYPYNTIQTIVLPMPAKTSAIIVIDIKTFLSAIDLSKQHHIMSPGNNAFLLSQIVAKSFSPWIAPSKK